jgi:hypothetical protein
MSLITRAARCALIGFALTTPAGTVAQADNGKLAMHLHQLNPGGLVGGKSIVGTKPAQQLHGSHGKPNFIIALEDGETIHGASTNDELGVGNHAKDVKIVAPANGHSLIHAGPGGTIVASGKGHNLIISHSKGATIILDSPGDEVIADGSDNRIICLKHAGHELIEIAKGEMVSKRCRGHHDQIQHLDAAPSSGAHTSATAHRSAFVGGNGSNEAPFNGNCDEGMGFETDCTVSSFPSRTLNGFWANEYVPAYECPGGHPFLLNVSYAPYGTTLPNGVQVQGLGPIGVSIRGTADTPLDATVTFNTEYRETRTLTGFPWSSATNWTIEPRSYRVILHCTKDSDRGYDARYG